MEQGWELVRYTGGNDSLLKEYYSYREPYIPFFPQELEKHINLIKYKILHCLRFISYRPDYDRRYLPILLSQNLTVEQTYLRSLERLLTHLAATVQEDYITEESFELEQQLYQAYSSLFDFLWSLEIKRTILNSTQYHQLLSNLNHYCDQEETEIVHRNEYALESERAKAVETVEQYRLNLPVKYLQDQYQQRKSCFVTELLKHKNLIAVIVEYCKTPTNFS
jgi:hypothetical protein